MLLRNISVFTVTIEVAPFLVIFRYDHCHRAEAVLLTGQNYTMRTHIFELTTHS